MLIHPFREGNGRTGRLRAILMGLQAKLPPLDFRSIKGKKRQKYFGAVRAGMGGDYEPMKQIFSDVVRRSRRPLHERDLAGIHGDRLQLSGVDFDSFNSSRRANRSVEQFFPQL